MTTPEQARIDSFLTPPGKSKLTEEERAALETVQVGPTPVLPGPAESDRVDAVELDRMVIDASLGRPQPLGLSPAAQRLWPTIKQEIEELLADPGVRHIEYPSEFVDAG